MRQDLGFRINGHRGHMKYAQDFGTRHACSSRWFWMGIFVLVAIPFSLIFVH
jgi:hypothetical protein